MPKRVTMHLRNSPFLILVITLLSLSLGTGAQNTGAQNPPPANPPAATQTQPTQQPGTAGQQPAPPQQQPAQPAGQGQPAVQGPVQAPDQNQAQPGQEPATEGGGFTFKAEAREVQLHATVIDDKQHLITNLDKNAFTVFEDGKPQTITSFRHEDIPVALGIVIDNSGSMREK